MEPGGDAVADTADGSLEDGPGVVAQFVMGGGWSEPWFIGLVLFHLTCTSLVLFSPTLVAPAVRASVFCLLCAIGLLSENLNAMAAIHWSEFAREQHFDHRGIFLLQVLTIPIVLNLVIVVVINLIEAANLMVKLKQAQLRKRARQSNRSQSS